MVKKGPFKHILTKRVNQDFLENLFSQLRALFGDNDHPGLLDLLRRFRILLIGKHAKILVTNTAVEMESKDEAIAKEEEEIVSKFVTKDIPVADVYELEEDEAVPVVIEEGVVTTVEVRDVYVDTDRLHKWNFGSQAEKFVAGYFAKRLEEKLDLDLGTKTSEAPQCDLDNSPWLRLISKGGLYVPHQDWMDDFRKFEAEFQAYHGKNIRRHGKIIDKFASILESKYGDKYDKSVYKFFAKFRTCMRVKTLNRLESLKPGQTVMTVREHKQEGQFEA